MQYLAKLFLELSTMWKKFGILALALSINCLSIYAGKVYLNNALLKRDTQPQLDFAMADVIERLKTVNASGNQALDSPRMRRRDRYDRIGSDKIDRIPFGHMNSIPLSQYSKIYLVMDSEAVKNVDNQRALTDLVRKIMSANRHYRGDSEQPGSDAIEQGESLKIDDAFDETRLARVTMKSIGRFGEARTARPISRTNRKFSEDEE